MMPRISVVAKISIRKKPLAISGMIRRMAATIQAAGLLISGHPRKVGRCAAAAGRTVTWASWASDISAPRQQALRPDCQYQHHDQEGHDDGVGRDVDRTKLFGEADDERAERGTGDRAHAADDDDDERGKQEADVFARRERLEGAADDAGDAGKPGTERKDQHE